MATDLFFVSFCPQASESQSPVVAGEPQDKTRSLIGFSTSLAAGRGTAAAGALKCGSTRKKWSVLGHPSVLEGRGFECFIVLNPMSS